MAIDLTGIVSVNEYYTNHYLGTILEEDIKDIVKNIKEQSEKNKERTPWSRLKELSQKFYTTNYKMEREKRLSVRYSIQRSFLSDFYNILGYSIENVEQYIPVKDDEVIPVLYEVKKNNGSPELWIIECLDEINQEEDMLHNRLKEIQYENNENEEISAKLKNMEFEELISKYIFSCDEPPRWILLSSYNEVKLIDRSKWGEKRILEFKLDDIFSRKEESTLQAMTILLSKTSICPDDGLPFLDTLSDNSHKHASAVSEDLKYALRQCIELLGNEVIRDRRERLHIEEFDNETASNLTVECLRYMYRILFLLYIEARPELGYAPIKSEEYLKGYSIESLRDIADSCKLDTEESKEGTYVNRTLNHLFKLIYNGVPKIDNEIINKAFTMEPLKAHIFDPDRTKMLNDAQLRNEVLVNIIKLMSISKPKSKKERPQRISYAQLGINQLGAVYEALLSYRGFLAEEDLYEVKKAGDKINELEVGYFVSESQLNEYSEDERVRNKDGSLKKYPKGTFIYRLAGREREKSASYYTPEVLTKCLVKYSLKELLKDKSADEILGLTICEPAMGSAAFLNEAVNQLSERYLELKQKETGVSISHDQYTIEKQKVKMYIADRNVYGVDLNPIAVELAEVSLWLNTIYNGAFVPWFGLQLVNGNSLIGARRQVYQKKLLSEESTKKWYTEAPSRVLPGEKRPANAVYHFLLGDPGMVDYNDKDIKLLGKHYFEKIKIWKKDFLAPYSDDDIRQLKKLSEIIDLIWDKHVKLRKELREKTKDTLNIFGHEENGDDKHLSTREKDKILKEEYYSEGMMNAGPYARLKFAMDYWCALWFWPIEQASLLPTRAEFLLELSLILEGDIISVKGNSEQMSMSFIEMNAPKEQMINLFSGDLGQVDLEMLCDKLPRLQLVKELSEKFKFLHWELEFADIFNYRGGFDLILGNPPWIRNEWKIKEVISEFYPLLSIRKGVKYDMEMCLVDNKVRNEVLNQYYNTLPFQNFLSAYSNYNLLYKQAGNMYKGFIVNSWTWMNKEGVTGLIHPEGIYDNPYGEDVRKILYKKLIYHFEFINEKSIFRDVAHTKRFSINISSNNETKKFINITNLFAPITIDQCFEINNKNKLMGLKDDNNNWNIYGHSQRIIKVDDNILRLFGEMFDDKASTGARMPELHAKSLLNVYKALDKNRNKMKYLDGFYCNQFYNESKANKEKKIVINNKYHKTAETMVYLGPNIWIGNPYFKTSKEKCIEKSDYNNVSIENCDYNYLPRTKYSSSTELRNEAPILDGGVNYNNTYKIFARRRLNLSMERSLISAIAPKKSLHVHSVLGVYVSRIQELVTIAGCMNSIIYDFYIKTYGKEDLYANTLGNLPVPNGDNIFMLWVRVLLLNGFGREFDQLWKDVWCDKFKNDSWGKADTRLNNHIYRDLDCNNLINKVVLNDFQRRQVLVEIDVLVSMFLNITLEDLKMVYRLQFPVLQQYEKDTWYDQNGKMIFTNNKGLAGVGIDRKQWNEVKDMKEGTVTKTYMDDTMPGGPVERTIVYEAPFDRCDRERDYEEVWKNFEKRFNN